MKNLFFIINKEKIYAYVVSIMTIVVIFFMSSMINSDLDDTETAASNSIENNQSASDNANNSNDSNNENETVETSGVIGEAVSTSTSSVENSYAEENTIQTNTEIE